jgi:aminopeptidase N
MNLFIMFVVVVVFFSSFSQGFAKWFEYLATDYIVPEHNVFSEFFSTQFLRYFDYCPHLLHHDANELNEKDFSFEGFIYAKGSCLMRMLHVFVGHEQFLRSIRLFLQRYAYRSATADEFWSCLEEITHLPISTSFDRVHRFVRFCSF